MIATIINVLAIVGGSILGLLLKGGIPKKVNDTVVKAMALSVILIGILEISGVGSKLSSNDTLVIIFSMALGALLGEIIDIDKKLINFGDKIEKKLNGRGGNISQGFVTASLLYCVGAMAIVGSLESGLAGSYRTLFAKSVLDGINSIIFTSTLGIGVMLSSVSVLLYQGSITLAAGLLKGILVTSVVNDMTAIGGVLIIAIALNMLGAAKIKVANLLPAIFIPILYQVIVTIFKI
jgi:uncharacterized membrane protein YqgA involved in biofilm formation